MTLLERKKRETIKQEQLYRGGGGPYSVWGPLQ
jgi:hypothetical protein